MTGNSGSPKALLVIDMLNDFILPGAPLRVPLAEGIVPRLRKRIQDARSGQIPVLYICDAHDPDDREFEDWPRHAVAGSPGAEVIASLQPAPGDTVIKKKRFSAFFGTDLEATLKRRGVRHLLVSGVVTNICVLYTVADARSRGYHVTVLKDCVAGLNPEDHAFALHQMEEILKAEVA